jgi:hypothetical protein
MFEHWVWKRSTTSGKMAANLNMLEAHSLFPLLKEPAVARVINLKLSVSAMLNYGHWSDWT